jgi:hypothetical protein
MQATIEPQRSDPGAARVTSCGSLWRAMLPKFVERHHPRALPTRVLYGFRQLKILNKNK